MLSDEIVGIHFSHLIYLNKSSNFPHQGASNCDSQRTGIGLSQFPKKKKNHDHHDGALERVDGATHVVEIRLLGNLLVSGRKVLGLKRKERDFAKLSLQFGSLRGPTEDYSCPPNSADAKRVLHDRYFWADSLKHQWALPLRPSRE